jgi:hypothetical protein
MLLGYPEMPDGSQFVALPPKAEPTAETTSVAA